MHRIRPHHSLNRSGNVALAILLVMALLCAQWIGLVHRVVHEGKSLSAAEVVSDPEVKAANINNVKPGIDSLWNDTVHHSCAAFDAAALGATVNSTPFVVPVLPNLHVLALWIAFCSWEVPFSCHFSSRAPPSR